MFDRTLITLAGGILALGTTSGASAQAGSKPAAPAPQPITRQMVIQKLGEEFKELDTNKDGFISKAEVQAAVSARAADAEAMLKQRQKEEFDKLDTNKDGKLTLQEYQAGATVTAKEGAADAKLQALDTNHDGKVSPAEYQALTLKQFDVLDKNKDGVLSVQERTPPAAQRR